MAISEVGGISGGGISGYYCSNVVNDCAERAVNMTIDFVDAAHIISRSLNQIGKSNLRRNMSVQKF